jgi:hypothetical protein
LGNDQRNQIVGGVANQVIKVDKKFLKKKRENAKLKIIPLHGQSDPGCKLLTSQGRFHSIAAGSSVTAQNARQINRKNPQSKNLLA